ncbi:MAG TPA: hypothetical protein VIF37_07940 [Methylobacter sp.]|jgi:hypothetical protein
MNWLITNYEWVFSGIGVTVLGWFLALKRSSSISQHHIGTGDNVAGDKISNINQINPQQNTIHRSTKFGLTTTKVISPTGVIISETTSVGK